MNNIDESIVIRRKDVADGIQNRIKSTTITINEENNYVHINFQDNLICMVEINETFYKISTVNAEWKDRTTYLCQKGEDDKWYYYVDSADETIEEINRLVIFTNTKNAVIVAAKKAHELRMHVTSEIFKEAYIRFIKQADENAVSGKANGSHLPYGFAVNTVYGCKLTQQFGQGAASKTPYINWHVVSIYYLPNSGKIVIGIEEQRYKYIKQMKPKKYSQLGNKADKVAIFYETYKDKVDYNKLYNEFMKVSDEVVNLGLW